MQIKWTQLFLLATATSILDVALGAPIQRDLATDSATLSLRNDDLHLAVESTLKKEPPPPPTIFERDASSITLSKRTPGGYGGARAGASSPPPLASKGSAEETVYLGAPSASALPARSKGELLNEITPLMPVDSQFRFSSADTLATEGSTLSRQEQDAFIAKIKAEYQS